MNLTTFTSRAAAALVAAVAGFSSYQHIVAVATRAGEHRSVAWVLPLAIDGLIVVGTMAMIEDKRAGRLPRLSARFALAFGIIATLAANIASAQPTWTARMVAAVPAISFLIGVEVLARTGKPRAVGNVTVNISDQPASPLIEPANAEVTAPESRDVITTSDPREAARGVYRAAVAAGEPISGAELARRFGKSPRWGVERVAEVRKNGTRDLAEVTS